MTTPDGTSMLASCSRLETFHGIDTLANEDATASDQLARLAAHTLHVPVVLVTFVEPERQWFAGQFGLARPGASRREAGLSLSFCRHVVLRNAPLIVSDVRNEALLADNPAISELGVVAYAGVPIYSKSGDVLGALCAIDHAPRVWSAHDISMLSDISAFVTAELERLHSAATLHRSLEAQVRVQARALEAMGQAAVVANRDGVLIYGNGAAERASGWPRGELQGQFCLNLVADEDRERAAGLLAAVQQGIAQSAELRLRRRDGTIYPVLSNVSAVSDDSGQIEGIVAIITDLTAQRQAEAERLQLERELWAAQRLEGMGLLASGAAHDFNNLLTFILGNVELALLELPQAAPAALSLHQIKHAARRAAELAQQLLAYAGKGRVQIQTLDVNPLIADMMQLLRSTLPPTITITQQFTPDSALIKGDIVLMRQVIMNLIVNAAEAIIPSGGSISVHTEVRRFAEGEWLVPQTCQKLPGGDYVVLEVSDTGCGMDARLLETIFDPFFTTKASGHGLGLSVVLGIVRQHHGAMRVASSVGSGTTFAICLPCAAPSS